MAQTGIRVGLDGFGEILTDLMSGVRRCVNGEYCPHCLNRTPQKACGGAVQWGHVHVDSQIPAACAKCGQTYYVRTSG